ncbi:hypothetical protein, partial [Clostridium sp.]|uniref:hypothetical protein n=1 Tax=Clostridium sp. TaxID=1506 RepID=UPI00257AF3E0
VLFCTYIGRNLSVVHNFDYKLITSFNLKEDDDKNKYIIGDCQTVVCGRATIVWQLFLWKQTLFFMRTEIFFHKLRCMYNLFKIKTFNRQN